LFFFKAPLALAVLGQLNRSDSPTETSDMAPSLQKSYGTSEFMYDSEEYGDESVDLEDTVSSISQDNMNVMEPLIIEGFFILFFSQ